MIEQVPESSFPAFADLERQLEQAVFGNVNVQIKVHNKVPVGVVYNVFQEVRPKDNTDAGRIILSQILGSVKEKKSGQLSFTVCYDNGKISKIINQFYETKSFT